MDKANCPLCGADNPAAYFQREDRFSGDKFHLAKCSECDMIYLPERPSADNLDAYYPEDYEAYYLLEGKSTAREWHLRRALEMQLQYVETHQPNKGTLMDVGCATGNFLKIAQENGWQVLGIEPVENAAQMARDYYQLDIITGTLDDAELAPNSLDVITMWDVLEHLPDPEQSFQKSRQLLKPDGLLVFSIPNLDSFDRYLFGRNWIGWDAPRHFNLFTDQTLQQLLGKTGFTAIDKKCILGGKGTFLLSLDMVLEETSFAGEMKRFYPFLSAILWPYRQISYLVKRGPIITYAVRKNEENH